MMDESAPRIPHSLGLTAAEWEWKPIGTGESGDRVWRLSRAGHAACYLKVSARGVGIVAAERDRLGWLAPRLPVPEVLGFVAEDGVEYLVTAEVPGLAACDAVESGVIGAEALIPELAHALRQVHAIPVADCPFLHRLDERIPSAVSGARSVGRHADAEVFLSRPRPAEHPVFTHGDYCEPNVMIHEGRVSAFIDVGYAGVADPYTDFAQMTFTLHRNGHAHLRDLFFREYGLNSVDESKLEYYQTLERLHA